MNNKVVLGFQFLNSRGEYNPNATVYRYWASEDLLKALPDLIRRRDGEDYNYDSLTVYNIIRDGGYNYRNTPVALKEIVFDAAKMLDYNAENELVELEKIFQFDTKSKFRHTVKVYTKKSTSIIPSGHCSVDESALKGTFTIDKDCIKFSSNVNTNDNENEKKGVDNMFNRIFKNVEYGAAKDVVFSVNGPAFKTAEGTYIAKNKYDDGYTEVDGLTFNDMDSFCYMFPVSKKDIKIGDYVRHNNTWVRVIDVLDNGCLYIDKIFAQERAEIFPTKNIFGFDFYVKLVNLADDLFATSANENNPFGNILPFLLLSGDGGSNLKDMLPLMLLSNGAGGDGMKNLLPLMLLSGDNKQMKDMLPLMLLGGNNIFGNN